MADEQLSDLDLLAGWRRGDRNMGNVLYYRYAARISGFFRRNVYDRSQVESLTQDTFMALFESRSTIQDLQAYLFRTAFYKFTHYIRQRRGLPLHDDEATLADTERPASDFIPDPEYVQSQREDKRLLMRAIRRLSPKYQWVLELSFWEELPAHAIAQTLGLPEGTIRSRLRLAKVALDEKLAELAGSPEALKESTMSTATWQLKIQTEILESSELGPQPRHRS